MTSFEVPAWTGFVKVRENKNAKNFVLDELKSVPKQTAAKTNSTKYAYFSTGSHIIAYLTSQFMVFFFVYDWEYSTTNAYCTFNHNRF